MVGNQTPQSRSETDHPSGFLSRRHRILDSPHWRQSLRVGDDSCSMSKGRTGALWMNRDAEVAMGDGVLDMFA